MSEDQKIRDTVDAVKGVLDSVPVYQDALQPATRELGKNIHTLARCVTVAFAPLRGLVWGMERIEEFVVTAVGNRLQNVPDEEIVTPPLNLLGPAVESLRFTGSEPTLASMYERLIATSMDAKTAHDAHPAFVEIIRQLTPDEAKIVALFAQGRNFPLITIEKETPHERNGKPGKTLNWVYRHFSLLGYQAGCNFPEAAPRFIDNICRLGLAVIPSGGLGGDVSRTVDEAYMPLRNHPAFQEIVDRITPPESPRIVEKVLRVTDLGQQFRAACIADDTHNR